MGPALLELYATPPSIKRQLSEKRDSSPQLFNPSSTPTTGRPMTRTLSMKAELIKDSTDCEKKLAASRSVESTYSLGGYSIKGGFMSRSSGGVSSSLASSPSSSSLLLLPKSKTPTTTPPSTTTTIPPSSSSLANNVSPKCSLAKYFRLKFIGSAILDRRYTLPMLPWIIHDIRRNSIHRGWKDIELEVNDICLKAVVKGERVPLFVHSHQFVSKFSPDPSDKASFTYLYRDHPDSQYTVYLFQSTSESMVLDLINAMREATKVLNFHNGSNLIQRSGTSNLDNILSNSQQFEVMYVGKIKVYQKRAPPSFIDDAVENLRTSEPVKVKFSEKEVDQSVHHQCPSSTDSETSVTPTPFNYTTIESGSLSTSNSPTTTPTIVNQLGMQRPRSISSLTTCKEYKETLDEESPKEEVVMVTCLPKSVLASSPPTSVTTLPVTITCTSHTDEKDSIFSDDGRESMDDNSLNFSRPGSSASTASGGGSIFGSSTCGGGGASLHLPSCSLITNTQSLDEQGRASIMRDLEVCSKHNPPQDLLSPIPSPNPPEEIYSPEDDNKKLTSSPIKIEINDPRVTIDTGTPEMKVTTLTPTPNPTSPSPSLLSSSSSPPPLTMATLSPEKVSTPSSPANNNSGNIPVRKLSTEKQVSLPYRTRTNSGGNSDLRRNRQSTKFQNRTMLFLIGRLEICLISPDLHQILFNKTFNYVSHCSQGVKYLDHFGFICREPSFYPSETYVGYVFRCQTDKLVNEIMHTLKQAFHNAHHSYQVNKNKSTVICETCPMQWFHRLCVDVESLPAEKAQTVILQRLDSLPDSDKNEVMSMYEGSQVSSIEEQNEIIMMLLRGMSERKQQKHNHHGKDDKRNSISTLDNLKQKARKSLSNSFETILKRAGSPSIANYYNQSSSRIKSNRNHTLHETRARASTISGSIHCPNLAQGDSTDDLSSLSNPSPKHGNRSDHSFFEVASSRPRSSTIGDVKDLQESGGRSGSISGNSGPTSGTGIFGSGSGSSSGFGSVGGSISEGTPRSESMSLNSHGTQNKSPLFNIFMKIGTNNKTSVSSSFDSASETGGRRRGFGDGYTGSSLTGSEGQSFGTWSSSSSGSCKQSAKEQRGWRKTIFSNIKTTTTTKFLDKYDSQDSSRYSLDSSSDNSSFNSSSADANVTLSDGDRHGQDGRDSIKLGKPKKSSTELRDLWKKAINQQITLIQMEKENKRLQANQNVVTCKRMKLDYEEITPCLKETSKMWEELLKRDPSDSSLEYLLKDSIKKGVPRSKRGEIWQFIARYNKQNNRLMTITGCKDVGTIDPDKPYRELLQQLTAQQHAILVDLGRTFPKHPYFAQALGAGQLSLFNLLKAYSLFDVEVGYCQGLSFVAAILLLHMNEDESFEMMKYLLFHLGLRRQYKPDMSALQMQLYQLTRLLYDFHHDIYQHFDTHDIPPTLYAAPWFLTLFASQFPIGFVARLFDIIFLFGIEAIFRLSIVLLATYHEAILSCTSFESIMELLKTEIPQMDAIQMERVFNQVLSRDISKQLIVYETEYNLLQEEVSSLTSATTSFGSTSGANSELFGSNGNIPHPNHHRPVHHQGSLPTSLSPVKGQQFKSTLSFTTTSTQYDQNKSINNYVDCSTSTINSPIKELPCNGANNDGGHGGEDSGRLNEFEVENKLLKGQNMELLDQLHVAQSNVYSLESSIETLKSTIKRLESRVRSVEEERDALFDSLNMLRQRTTSSVNQGSSSGAGTPLAASPSPSESTLE